MRINYRKTFLILFLTSIPLQAFSDCLSSLLKDHQFDSTSYQITPRGGQFGSPVEGSQYALRQILENHGCDSKEINLKEINCQKVLGEMFCKAKSRIGYFIIIPDYVSSYNIIFSRWD